MKKYWKILFIPLFICLVLGFVWTEGLLSSSKSAANNMRIIAEEGDATYVDSLAIYGGLEGLTTGEWEPFEFMGESFQESIQMNPIQQLDAFYSGSNKLNRYLVDYRSFLRGKYPEENNFAETEEAIYYAGFNSDVAPSDFYSQELRLSVLNKETKEEENYSINASDLFSGWANIQAVIPKSSDLYIVAEVYDYSENQRNDGEATLQIYSLNLETIASESSLTLVYDFESVLSSNSTVQLVPTSKESSFIVVRTLHVNHSNYDEQYTQGNYYLFNFETKEVYPVNIEDSFNYPYALTEQENVYIIDEQEELFDIYSYNPINEELVSLSTIEKEITETKVTPEDNFNYSLYDEHIFLEEGRFIFIEQPTWEANAKSVQIQINAVDSGELLFKGSFEPEGKETLPEYRLDIYDVQLLRE